MFTSKLFVASDLVRLTQPTAGGSTTVKITDNTSAATSNFYKYIPNLWIVFFMHCDWLLELGIVCAIYLPARESREQNSFFVFYGNRRFF